MWCLPVPVIPNECGSSEFEDGIFASVLILIIIKENSITNTILNTVPETSQTSALVKRYITDSCSA